MSDLTNKQLADRLTARFAPLKISLEKLSELTGHRVIGSRLAELSEDEAAALVVEMHPEFRDRLGRYGDAGSPFYESTMPKRLAAELAAELGEEVDKVLGWGEEPNGNSATYLDPTLVQFNRQGELDGMFADAPGIRGGSLSVSDATVRKSYATSNYLALDQNSRVIIDRLFAAQAAYLRLTQGGRAFRVTPAEMRPLRQDPNNQDSNIVAYEYDNPLWAGHATRIKVTAALRLRLNKSAGFPLIDPRLEQILVGEMTELSIAPKVCNACHGQMDQLMKSKLKRLLDGKSYLRGKKDETFAVLREVGIQTHETKEVPRFNQETQTTEMVKQEEEVITDLSFKRNHPECNELLKEMKNILNSMWDQDFDDPAVIAEFVRRAMAGVMRVYTLLKPSYSGLTRNVLRQRAADILDVLMEGS